MADIIDIFSKKKNEKKDNPDANFFDRFVKCLKEIEDKGACSCKLCVSKKDMARRLFSVVMYLCKEYELENNEKLYMADAFEISLLVAELLKRELNT